MLDSQDSKHFEYSLDDAVVAVAVVVVDDDAAVVVVDDDVAIAVVSRFIFSLTSNQIICLLRTKLTHTDTNKSMIDFFSFTTHRSSPDHNVHRKGLIIHHVRLSTTLRSGAKPYLTRVHSISLLKYLQIFY